MRKLALPQERIKAERGDIPDPYYEVRCTNQFPLIWKRMENLFELQQWRTFIDFSQYFFVTIDILNIASNFYDTLC